MPQQEPWCISEEGLFTQVRGETVWKIGTGTRSGSRRPLGGAEVESIIRLLAARTHAREVSSYFPNSFGRVILRSSPRPGSGKFFWRRQRTIGSPLGRVVEYPRADRCS